MKRLRKKANLELYHGTSVESFQKICDDGGIRPYQEHESIGVGDTDGGIVERPDAVYLADSEALAYEYAIRQSWTLGFAVVLKIFVSDTSKLEADRADLDAYFMDDEGNESDVPEDLTYEDSLGMSGQCIYAGTIPLNDVAGVQFVTEGQTKYDGLIKPDQWHSLQEARQIISKIQQ